MEKFISKVGYERVKVSNFWKIVLDQEPISKPLTILGETSIMRSD